MVREGKWVRVRLTDTDCFISHALTLSYFWITSFGQSS